VLVTSPSAITLNSYDQNNDVTVSKNSDGDWELSITNLQTCGNKCTGSTVY